MDDGIVFVSGNAGKAREVEAILGTPVERLPLDLPEIQALDVAEVVRHKALEAFAAAGRPVLVEDTGLYVDALGGLPGALVKWFLQTVGPAGICAMLPAGAPRGATARTAWPTAPASSRPTGTSARTSPRRAGSWKTTTFASVCGAAAWPSRARSISAPSAGACTRSSTG